MTVEFPVVISNSQLPRPLPEAYRTTVRQAYVVPATAHPGGMPIVHADTVTISDEARAAYQRMVEGAP
ncbi:MAG: hypothetical protein PVF97_03315 [Desulfobacterales bacterium]|jgi:hypothetical protein